MGSLQNDTPLWCHFMSVTTRTRNYQKVYLIILIKKIFSKLFMYTFTYYIMFLHQTTWVFPLWKHCLWNDACDMSPYDFIPLIIDRVVSYLCILCTASPVLYMSITYNMPLILLCFVLWSSHQSFVRSCHLLQLSAVITLLNIVRNHTNNYRYCGRLSIRCWIYKRHPIPRPNVNSCEKIDGVITASHCTHIPNGVFAGTGRQESQ